MPHRRDNLILFAGTSAVAVLLCKSKGIPLIKVPLPFIFIQLVKCDRYSPKKKKKNKKKFFQDTLLTNIHPKGVHFDLLYDFRWLFFLLLLFFFQEGALLCWPSAIHSEGFTQQSFQLWVSNKLIFVRVFLLSKEGQFYAGFYGRLHKGFSLCASALAGTATLRSSLPAITSCNEHQRKKIINWWRWWFSSADWNIDSFPSKQLIKTAHGRRSRVQP